MKPESESNTEAMDGLCGQPELGGAHASAIRTLMAAASGKEKKRCKCNLSHDSHFSITILRVSTAPPLVTNR